MRRFAPILLAATVCCLFASQADAQWATRVYHPVVAPQPIFVTPQPVFVAPQQVHRVYRAPMVIQQPPRIYKRRRPILGGTVVRTRPGYTRVVW